MDNINVSGIDVSGFGDYDDGGDVGARRRPRRALPPGTQLRPGPRPIPLASPLAGTQDASRLTRTQFGAAPVVLWVAGDVATKEVTFKLPYPGAFRAFVAGVGRVGNTSGGLVTISKFEINNEKQSIVGSPPVELFAANSTAFLGGGYLDLDVVPPNADVTIGFTISSVPLLTDTVSVSMGFTATVQRYSVGG